MDFDIFLAEMLPIKSAKMPPQTTCASALPVKTGKHENHIFHSIGLCCTHNALVRCLPERKQLSSVMCLIASNICRYSSISH